MHILIIGGGAIGLCSAYYLRRAGHRVTILDDQPQNAQEGCSYGNAGMIVPSHFVPLANPSVIRQGIRWLFRSDSPLYIRPGMKMDLAAWLWHFMRAAKDSRVEDAMPILRDLGVGSRQLFDHLGQDLGVYLGAGGLSMLYKTSKYEKEERETAEQAEKLGIPTQILSAGEAQEMEPNMPLNIMGGVHYPMDAHIEPGEFMHALKENVKVHGVKIFHSTTVNNIERKKKSKSITSIQTNKGEFTADGYVLAAGAWSAKLAKKLSLSLPLQAGKGYSMSLNQPKDQLNIPSILCEAKVAITPMGETIRFAGTMEIGGTNLNVNSKRVQGIINSIPEFMPNVKTDLLEKSPVWAGLRPCSPDGLPYIGTTKKADNLIVATGHAMMGISLAPITGKIISEIVSGETPSVDLKLLSPDRY